MREGGREDKENEGKGKRIREKREREGISERFIGRWIKRER